VPCGFTRRCYLIAKKQVFPARPACRLREPAAPGGSRQRAFPATEGYLRDTVLRDARVKARHILAANVNSSLARTTAARGETAVERASHTETRLQEDGALMHAR
jgi:hypothetical protein